jgi:hypothetical protein
MIARSKRQPRGVKEDKEGFSERCLYRDVVKDAK